MGANIHVKNRLSKTALELTRNADLKAFLSSEIQWVPLNIIPSVHEKIMTISRIFYYPMYSYYRGYRGTIGPV